MRVATIHPEPAARADGNPWLAWPLTATLAAGLLATALLVDPLAADPFDAPKWLAAQATAALGGICLLWWRAPAGRVCVSPLAWASLAALLLAAIGLVSATVAADAAVPSWQATRSMLLMALLLPLGASRALDGKRWRWLVWAAGVAIGVNALLSLAQAAGLPPIWPTHVRSGGRFPTGALLGNEGLVALACALAVPACVAVLAWPGRQRQERVAALLLGVACIAAILINRQLTALLAMGCGVLLVALVRLGRTGMVWALMLLALAGLGAVAVPPLRQLAVNPVQRVDSAELQPLTTYRLGAWAAAERMWQTQPWLGHGPGSYRLQSQQHRLAAEIESRQRLEPPITATGFAQAHNEYLQLAAEAGLPTLWATLAAFALLIVGLLRLTVDAEIAAILGVLATGAVAALAWFPLQVPLIAMLLLLAAGRGWRRLAKAPTQ